MLTRAQIPSISTPKHPHPCHVIVPVHIDRRVSHVSFRVSTACAHHARLFIPCFSFHAKHRPAGLHTIHTISYASFLHILSFHFKLQTIFSHHDISHIASSPSCLLPIDPVSHRHVFSFPSRLRLQSLCVRKNNLRSPAASALLLSACQVVFPWMGSRHR